VEIGEPLVKLGHERIEIPTDDAVHELLEPLNRRSLHPPQGTPDGVMVLVLAYWPRIGRVFLHGASA
jgi:hypothetical protein